MKTKVDLLNGSIAKGLLAFAFPLLVSNIFQQLYNTADTVIVGRFLGDESLAAMGACAAIYELFVAFALGVGNGLSIVTARFYGAGDEERLKKSVAASFVIGVVISVTITALAAAVLRPLLVRLQTPADIIEQSYAYISTVTLFVIVMFAYNLFAGLLKAIGNSVMAVVFLIIASVINVILDIYFITRLDMGIKGAAVATVVAQFISAALCFAYILKKCPVLIPSARHFAFDSSLYQDMLGQGISMGLMSAIVSSGTVILQSSINTLGTLTIAGHTAARRAISFTMMPLTTVSMALATFVSQNYGAGNGKRVRKGVSVAFKIAAVWSVIALAVFDLGARWIIAFISSSSQQAVLDIGASYLSFNSAFAIVLGELLNLRMALQGMGRKVITLVSSVIELVGKILFAKLIIPFARYSGVIWCEPAVWTAMCIQLIFAFYKDPFIQKTKYEE